MPDGHYYVYILTNTACGVLYTGVTNDLRRRLEEHRLKLQRGFTWKYNAARLVYVEATTDVTHAIARKRRSRVGSAGRRSP